MQYKNGLYLISLLLLVNVGIAQSTWQQPSGDPADENWQTYPVSEMPASYIINNPEVANLIPSSRINDLSPEAKDAYIEAKFPGVSSSLGGTSSTLSGNILTVSGTSIDLSTMQGRTITVSGSDVLVDGNKFTNAQNLKSDNGRLTADRAQYVSSGTTTLINAEGVSFSPQAFSVGSADSIAYEGSTSTKVIDFQAESGKFTTNSADLVIVETISFSKIKNSNFILNNNQLISASIICDKPNSSVTFPNLIQNSSNTIKVENCQNGQNIGVNYRQTISGKKAIQFSTAQNITTTFIGLNNITFNATKNNGSIAIRP